MRPSSPTKGPKAWQGLIALVRAGRWRRHDHIVFIHTGGAPALFAYREELSLY
jgi:L-cysteate sulfo-lyase